MWIAAAIAVVVNVVVGTAMWAMRKLGRVEASSEALEEGAAAVRRSEAAKLRPMLRGRALLDWMRRFKRRD